MAIINKAILFGTILRKKPVTLVGYVLEVVTQVYGEGSDKLGLNSWIQNIYYGKSNYGIDLPN